MIGEDHEVTGTESATDAAGGIGKEEFADAEGGEYADGKQDLGPVKAFVVMGSTVEDGDGATVPLGEEESTGVTDDGSDGETGDVGVGEFDGVGEGIGDGAEPGAEHDPEGGLEGATTPDPLDGAGRIRRKRRALHRVGGMLAWKRRGCNPADGSFFG
jgi:hypothetical protein